MITHNKTRIVMHCVCVTWRSRIFFCSDVVLNNYEIVIVQKRHSHVPIVFFGPPWVPQEMLCFMEIVDTDGFPTGEVWGFPDEMHAMVHIWFWLMAATFFCLLEVGCS